MEANLFPSHYWVGPDEKNNKHCPDTIHAPPQLPAYVHPGPFYSGRSAPRRVPVFLEASGSAAAGGSSTGQAQAAAMQNVVQPNALIHPSISIRGFRVRFHKRQFWPQSPHLVLGWTIGACWSGKRPVVRLMVRS